MKRPSPRIDSNEKSNLVFASRQSQIQLGDTCSTYFRTARRSSSSDQSGITWPLMGVAGASSVTGEILSTDLSILNTMVAIELR